MSLVCAAVLALTLVACGSGSSGGGGGGGAKSEPVTAESIAKRMALPDSTTLRVTGDNDPNHMLGRTGGYSSKVAISIPEKRCARVKQECGLEVEVFPDVEGAKQRAAYIKALAKSAPIFADEYDTRHGAALLRVQGDVKQSRALRYQAAFKKAMG
jgi:hypothetical protein